LLARRSSPREIAERVRWVIGLLFAAGGRSPEIQSVAAEMGTSVRTLQRRLRATGSTYGDVVQQARCAAAQQLLKDRRRRIGEIARKLGYSDHAHFTRAFQRWTGVTPREFRRHDRRMPVRTDGSSSESG
jgi:AraC-like DNA-binding protein